MNLSRFFARMTLRRVFARWGWLPLGLIFLLAYSIEARAQEFCGEYEDTSYIAWRGSYGLGIVGVYDPNLHHGSAGAAQAYMEGVMPESNGDCYGTPKTPQWNGPWEFVGGPSSVWRRLGNWNTPTYLGCSTSGNIELRVQTITVNSTEPPPWWGTGCADCTGLTPFTTNWSYSSFGLSNLPLACRPVDGRRCAYSVEGTGAVGGRAFGVATPTGGTCSESDGLGEPEIPAVDVAPEVTCTVVAGNVHCWAQDSDCQFVNGEKWCMDDVEVQPVVTLDSQVLALPSQNAVVDSQGTPVPPDSVVLKPDAAGTGEDTVHHYNSETVNQNYSSGAVGGNPAQSGTPGAGTVPGTGDGPGDGDGEEGGGGSASGGETCDALPTCDGDPVGCAILAQAWRQRCVDGLDGADIAALAGESVGSTLESITGELVEGDGTGLGIQSLFNDFFTAQGGDWWARGATCVTDPVITLPASFGLSSLTIELSRWCAILAMLGQLILALAWLQALRILVGAV